MESKNIIFNPEFLRESKTFYDNGQPKFLVGWEYEVWRLYCTLVTVGKGFFV